MPELPDIAIYLEALQRRVAGEALRRARVASPFLLRTAMPPLASIEGRKITGLRRLGKRIAFGFENQLWLVLHLMIAGRLHWREAGAQRTTEANKGNKERKPTGKQKIATVDFSNGSLLLTEASTKRRAALHL